MAVWGPDDLWAYLKENPEVAREGPVPLKVHLSNILGKINSGGQPTEEDYQGALFFSAPLATILMGRGINLSGFEPPLGDPDEKDPREFIKSLLSGNTQQKTTGHTEPTEPTETEILEGSEITWERVLQELSQEKFRSLFPEIRSEIISYTSNPRCGLCRKRLLRGLFQRRGVIEGYFSELDGDEVKLSVSQKFVDEPEPDYGPKNNQSSILIPKRLYLSVRVSEMEKFLEDYPPPVYRIESTSRWEDEISIFLLKIEPKG